MVRGLRISVPGLPSLRQLAYPSIIVGILVLQLAGPTGMKLAYVGLAGWALTGPKAAIRALSLSWLIGLLNPIVFGLPYRAIWHGDAGANLLLKWIVVLAAFASCGFRAVVTRKPLPTSVVWITLFCAFIACTSLATSFLPGVSLSKAFAFWAGAVTVLLAYQQSRAEWEAHHQWFTALAWVFVISNVALLPRDDMYRIHDGLYRGLFYHPQITGLVSAVVVAWFGGQALTRTPLPWSSVLGFAGAGAVLWVTGSRTGLFAVLLALLVAAVLTPMRRSLLADLRAALLRPRALASGLLLLAAAVAAGAQLQGGILDFVRKRESTAQIDASNPFSTREAVITQQLENFREHPWFGSGFGVPSTAAQVWSVRNAATGLTVSAATEKGFLPTAILEESGVIGAVLFVCVVVSLFGRVIRNADFAALWMALTTFLVNFGECDFFSLGGVGLFLWVMLGFATVPVPNRAVGSTTSHLLTASAAVQSARVRR